MSDDQAQSGEVAKGQLRRPSLSGGKGAGCLFLFGLPFAAGGLVALAVLMRSCLFYYEARHWQEVPARIVRAELKTNTGDDSNTYEAVAEYTYAVNDRRYTGTRVSIYSGSDNIGSFQKDAYNELKSYEQSGRMFRCYVNPKDPAEAVLYRDLRWTMVAFYSMFAVIFSGVGFGILIGAVWSHRSERGKQQRKQEYPGEPWRWRKDWAEGQVRSSSKTTLLLAWGFAVFWNVISWPMAIFVIGPLVAKGERLAAIFLLFPIVGIGLLSWAVYETLRWRKFGESVFEMASMPGVIGGKLAGVVRTSAKVYPEEGFQVTLTCNRRTTTGSGKHRHTTTTILWQDRRVMARELLEDDMTQTAVPVLFGIPYDAQPSSNLGSGDGISWQLEVAASVPGVDYRATFEVPVYRTAESREDFVLDEGPIAQFAAPVDPQKQIADAGVSTYPAPGGGTRYVFGMARQLGDCIGLSVFFAIWTGAVFGMWHFQAPILFPIVFGLIDLLIACFLFDLWFYRSTVDVSRYGLTITGGPLGIGRTCSLEPGEIVSIKPVPGTQSGQRQYYSLAVHLQNNTKITAAKRIPSLLQAETIVRLWQAELSGHPGGAWQGI